MEVRRANRSDLLGVARVVHAACWETYTGFLKPQTISDAIASIYSPSMLKRRMLAGEVIVAVDEDEVVVGFVMSELAEDHISVVAVAVDPEHRRTGIAGQLIEAGYRSWDADLPVSMGVLLGSIDGEMFAEHMDFVPGEIVEQELCGEPVVERIWWHPAN